MSELYLVRHAQASFGEANYDRLSDLGHRQARWLGEYFLARGLVFDRIICGDMLRHRQTMDAIVEAMSGELPAPEAHPQWNEFDFEVLVETYLAQNPHDIPPDGAPRRKWFGVLRKALHAWSEGRLPDTVPERWEQFEARVSEGLSLATRSAPESSRVLVVSSGGAISMAIRQVLQAPPAAMVQINLQTRNCSYSHFFFNRDGIQLSGFNHVPHLEHPDRDGAITYY